MPGKAFWADVDTRSYMMALNLIDREALPRAVAATLNAPADAIAKESRRNVEKRMTVRTKYTTNSIKQDRTARGTNFRTMHSRVGTMSPYLPIQDEGGTIRANRSRIPIPTLASRTGRSFARKVATRYRMKRLGQLGGGSPNVFMGRPRGGNRPVGIYERYGKNRRLRMLRNLESSSVRIKPTRWFADPLRKYGTRQYMGAQFKKHARAELNRVTRRAR